MAPPSNQPLFGAAPSGGPPTLSQYFLNPREPHRMLGSELPYYLPCSELRVALPNRADADPCGRAPIQSPAHLLLGGAMPRRRCPTGS